MKKTHRIILRITQFFLVALWFGAGTWGIAAMVAGMVVTDLRIFGAGLMMCLSALIIHDLERRNLRPKFLKPTPPPTPKEEGE